MNKENNKKLCAISLKIKHTKKPVSVTGDLDKTIFCKVLFYPNWSILSIKFTWSLIVKILCTYYTTSECYATGSHDLYTSSFCANVYTTWLNPHRHINTFQFNFLFFVFNGDNHISLSTTTTLYLKIKSVQFEYSGFSVDKDSSIKLLVVWSCSTRGKVFYFYLN